jgi:hypothetical protein
LRLGCIVVVSSEGVPQERNTQSKRSRGSRDVGGAMALLLIYQARLQKTEPRH